MGEHTNRSLPGRWVSAAQLSQCATWYGVSSSVRLQQPIVVRIEWRCLQLLCTESCTP